MTITHRCNELLEYNKDNFKPCAVQFDRWFFNEDRCWILKALETDFEWDSTFMWNTAKITYCPFCGEKLKKPLTLVESE